MKTRSLTFALSRPRVWIPSLIGVGLILGGVTNVGGIILLVFGALKLRGVLGHRDLDDRLRLKADKRRHRIYRRLSQKEREEVILLDRYCAALRSTGAQPGLTDEIMDQGWEIIREARGQDASGRLRRFRLGLPALLSDAREPPEDRLADRVQQELHILHATRREVEAVG